MKQKVGFIQWVRDVFSIRSKSPWDDFWYNPITDPVLSGVVVNEESALKMTTVYACIRILAETLAYLPLFLYKRDANEDREKVTNRKIWFLLAKQPNPEMTAFRFWSLCMGYLVAWGNCYNYIERDVMGRPIGLWPMRPDLMQVRRNPNTKQIEYIYSGGGGQIPPMSKKDVWHMAGFGFSGLVGYSPIKVCQEAIGLGLAAEEFSARFYGDGTHPGIVLSHPRKLKPDTHTNLQKSLTNAYTGLGKSHRLMLLEEAMTVEKIGIPPEEAQFIQSRAFSVLEICRLFRVPPHLVQSLADATYTNIEHQGLDFVTYTMGPWLKMWEQGIESYFLTQNERLKYYFEFLVTSLLRGDYASRTTGYASALQNGWMNRDEVRRLENMNSMGPGGKKYTVQLNMVDIEDLPDKEDLKPQPPNDYEGEETPEETPPESKSERQWSRWLAVRSVAGRDRIVQRHHKLFLDAATRAIKNETDGLKKGIKRSVREKESIDDLKDWLHNYYESFSKYLRKQLQPVFQVFAEAVHVEASGEVGIEPEMTLEFKQWIRKYIDQYIVRHTDSSIGQVVELAEEDLDLVEERMDEWTEKRPEKIATNETHRLASGMALVVFFSVGKKGKWRIRGPSTCPWCKRLEGKTVKRGEHFADEGTKIHVKGQKPMKINSRKGHPPLHRKCDCFITPA